MLEIGPSTVYRPIRQVDHAYDQKRPRIFALDVYCSVLLLIAQKRGHCRKYPPRDIASDLANGC